MQTRVLFLDDSGKPDSNHPSGAVVIAGFSIPSDAVPTLSRRVLGAKAKFYPQRGNPSAWEIKAADLLAGVRRRLAEGDLALLSLQARIDRALSVPQGQAPSTITGRQYRPRTQIF